MSLTYEPSSELQAVLEELVVAYPDSPDAHLKLGNIVVVQGVAHQPQTLKNPHP